jgi:hypothetical protein
MQFSIFFRLRTCYFQNLTTNPLISSHSSFHMTRDIRRFSDESWQQPLGDSRVYGYGAGPGTSETPPCLESPLNPTFTTVPNPNNVTFSDHLGISFSWELKQKTQVQSHMISSRGLSWILCRYRTWCNRDGTMLPLPQAPPMSLRIPSDRDSPLLTSTLYCFPSLMWQYSFGFSVNP